MLKSFNVIHIEPHSETVKTLIFHKRSSGHSQHSIEGVLSLPMARSKSKGARQNHDSPLQRRYTEYKYFEWRPGAREGLISPIFVTLLSSNRMKTSQIRRLYRCTSRRCCCIWYDVRPFDYTAFGVNRKVGIPLIGVTTSVGWLSLL